MDTEPHSDVVAVPHPDVHLAAVPDPSHFPIAFSLGAFDAQPDPYSHTYSLPLADSHRPGHPRERY